MLKVSKGAEQEADAARALAVKDGMTSIILPPVPATEKEQDIRGAVASATEALSLQRQAERDMASRHAEALNQPGEPEKIIIPPVNEPELPVMPPDAARSPAERIVDKETIERIANAVRPEPVTRPDISHIELPESGKDLNALSRTAERVAGELAEQKRQQVTLPQEFSERGRAIEHDEPARTHTIQKER